MPSEKEYRPYHPHQVLLLPPSLDEWLPDDHLAYFISDLVEHFDLRAIEETYEDELRGGPPYHPAMMVKLLLYAYCTGVYSSRRIATHVQEDVAFRVLAAGNAPDFRTINEFRRRHLGTLSGLFQQVLELAQRAGLVKLKHVALDGTKVPANASKHKAMSYDRLCREEPRLAAEVAEWFRRADANRRGGRCGVRPRPPRGRVAGGTAPARKPLAQDSRSQSRAGGRGQGEGGAAARRASRQSG